MSATFRQDIENTLTKWAFGFDNRDLSMLAECVTANAELSLRINDGDLIGPFAGRDAICEMVQKAWQKQGDQRRHLMSNIHIDSVGYTAICKSYVTIISIQAGAT